MLWCCCALSLLVSTSLLEQLVKLEKACDLGSTALVLLGWAHADYIGKENPDAEYIVDYIVDEATWNRRKYVLVKWEVRGLQHLVIMGANSWKGLPSNSAGFRAGHNRLEPG